MRIKRIYAPEGIRGTGRQRIPLFLDADDGELANKDGSQSVPDARFVQLNESPHGVLCVCEVWGQLLVPWSKITTVVYAKDGELLRAAEESPPAGDNASWQATGVPKSERVDGPVDIAVSWHDLPSGGRQYTATSKGYSGVGSTESEALETLAKVLVDHATPPKAKRKR